MVVESGTHNLLLDLNSAFPPVNIEVLRIAEVDTGYEAELLSLKHSSTYISSVDYTLPALGGCFGPGCRIAFGTDRTSFPFSCEASGHPANADQRLTSRRRCVRWDEYPHS